MYGRIVKIIGKSQVAIREKKGVVDFLSFENFACLALNHLNYLRWVVIALFLFFAKEMEWPETTVRSRRDPCFW